MNDEDQGQAVDTPDGEMPGEGTERSTTRRNLVIVAAGGAMAATVGLSSSAAAATTNAAPTSGPADPATAKAAAAPRASSKGKLGVTVNGRRYGTDAPGDTPLLYVLRDNLGFKGPKFGCGLSQCGACAVLSDGKQIRSCVTPLAGVTKSKITTLEGLASSYWGSERAEGDSQKLHPLQQAWIDEQVPQCGYCQNGMLIQAADLLSKNKTPSETEIHKAMDGHLCRCGTYNGIVRAIQRAAKEMK